MCFFFKLDLVTLLFYPFVMVNSIWVCTMWWHVQGSRIWRAILSFIHTFALFFFFAYIFVPRFRESAGTLISFVCPSVPSLCLSVTKTLTLAITFALLQIELWYLACVFFVTRPFRWYHVVTLTMTFDLLQGQICCRAGDHNSLNLLVILTLKFGEQRWPSG